MISPMEFAERHTQRPLCGFQIYRRYVCNGSASAGRARDLTAGKLTSKLSDRIADVRGRQ
jgi:hypothetical protein